jgi:hypothetical protein
LKDHTITHVVPGSATIEPCGATDDIRYVLNRQAALVSSAPCAKPDAAQNRHSSVSAEQPAGAGGLADAVIDNVDAQLPDQTDSTVRGGKVGQESKRGAY